jgi:hypothetical protein
MVYRALGSTNLSLPFSRNHAIEFNAKARSRKAAKEKGENGSQTDAHRSETRMARVYLSFAPCRLRAFALNSSSVTAWIRLTS